MDANGLLQITRRTGRYFIDYGGMGLLPTPIKLGKELSGPISEYAKDRLQKDASTWILNQQKAQKQAELEKQKKEYLQKLSIAEAKKSMILGRVAKGMDISQYSQADIDANIATNEQMKKSFVDFNDAVRNAKSMEDLKNLKVWGVTYNEQISTWEWLPPVGQPWANPTIEEKMNPLKNIIPQQTPAPVVSQPKQKGSRVLSTIRGGKPASVASVVAPIAPVPETPKETPVEQGKYGQFKIQDAQRKEIPAYITDKDTLAKINSAVTPEAKQAIVDDYNKLQAQTAGNNNVQFKNEADMNKDNTISNDEAKAFMEKHWAAAYNLAMATAKQKWETTLTPLDSGRKQVLDDIARGGGTKYNTKIDPNEQAYIDSVKLKDKQAYIDSVKLKDKQDDVIKNVNKYVMEWNVARTVEQRKLQKDALQAYKATVDPEMWKSISHIVQPQIAWVEAKQKAPTDITPEPKGGITTEQPDQVVLAWKAQPKQVIVWWDVNAGGNTKIDTIQKDNAPENLWQGQIQNNTTAKNIITKK